MAQTLNPTSVHLPVKPEIRELSKDAPYRWLRKGWDDFRSSLGPSLTLGMLFVIAGYTITIASWNIPVLTISFITGFLLVAPVLALGFYELSRRREQGRPMGLKALAFSWRDHGWAVLMLSLIHI